MNRRGDGQEFSLGMLVIKSVFMLALLAAALGARAEDSAGSPEIVDVFVSGQDGYATYRIPALVTSRRGTLLAFAEGRQTVRDHAANDIVLKRSTDAGRTWGPLQLIHDAGVNALNNPTAVVLRESGRILLMYQQYREGFDEHRAEPGLEGPNICRTFITHSDDDGASWSAPAEITAQVKRPVEVTSTASGPGNGIQLARGPHAGRVLMPFNQGPYNQWKVYAVISDDGGRTWRYGQTAPETIPGHANEVQFVELNDGSVMLNARNQGRGPRLRKVAISRDGGESWTATRTHPVLIEPACQASIIRHPAGAESDKAVLLFSNPASQTGRTNGTIRLSRDDGATWPAARVLYPGSFAYSSLASLPSGDAACLFERDHYRKISLARFSLAWIEESEE